MTMKRKCLVFPYLIIVFLFIFHTIPGFGAKTIQEKKNVILLTLNWPPYIGEDLPKKGYVYVLVKKAFNIMGYRCTIEFLPWNRVINKAKKGEADGYFPEYYSKRLEKYFYISNPFPGGPIIFLTQRKSHIKYNNISDLKKYRIGLVRGYINTEAIDSATYLTKDWARNDLINIKKLLKGRVDLIVIDKYVAYYLIKKYLPSQLSRVKPLCPIIEYKYLYVCFPKKNKGSKKLMQDFNKGLTYLKEKGILDNIIKKWRTDFFTLVQGKGIKTNN